MERNDLGSSAQISVRIFLAFISERRMLKEVFFEKRLKFVRSIVFAPL